MTRQTTRSILALSALSLSLIGSVALSHHLSANAQVNTKINASSARSGVLNGLQIRDRKNIGDNIFWIEQGKKRHIVNPNVFQQVFVSNILDTDEGKSVTDGDPVNENSLLLQCKNGQRIFLLDAGKKRHIVSPQAFKKHNFNPAKVVVQECAVVDAIPTGAEIK